MKTNKKQLVILTSIIASLSCLAFLSIETPYQGTPKGGVFGMIGVGIIIFLIYLINRKAQKN